MCLCDRIKEAAAYAAGLAFHDSRHGLMFQLVAARFPRRLRCMTRRSWRSCERYRGVPRAHRNHFDEFS